VTNILDISGSITTDGGDGQANCAGYPERDSGGGSGGSIYLITDNLVGNGAIISNGGSGDTHGGAGGGGRIAIYYTTKTFSGTITASGQTGYKNSGAGTIYQKSTAQSNFNLLIDNGNNIADSETPFSSSYIIDNMTVINSIVSFSENLNIDVDILSCVDSGTLIVTEINAEEILIGSGFQITHHPAATAGLYISAADLTIESGAEINGDGKGYAGGASLSDGTGPGKGFRLGGNAASGAGYGGNGGIDYEVDVGGSSYGSLSAPTDLGSGGGGGYYCNLGGGGEGGGSILINVTNILDISGSITTDGGDGQANCAGYPERDSGGGSGGSIYLITGTLSGNGIISSSGSSGDTHGGCGAAGRIAVYYTDNTSFTGLITVSGGTGYTTCGDGTLYEEILSQSTVGLSISNPIPSNNSVLPSGTTSTTIAISTNDNATCRYSNSSGELFSSMTQFSTTGETQHNSSIFGLQDAQGYDYYIKCQNISDLTDISDDYHTHFLVLDFILEECFPNQLGYWTFDHFNNNIVYDITGNNYATSHGGVTQSQPSQIGDGFEFDGEDGYLDVNGLEGVLPDSSFGFWITPNQDYGSDSGQTAPVVLLRDGLTEIFIDTDGSIKETYDGATITSSPAITWNQGEPYHILRTSNKFYLGSCNGYQISGPLNFSESNPEYMAPGSSVNLAVDNGFPPFNWIVSGTGFSLQAEIESSGTNILYANDAASGSATITVTDRLGQNAMEYVLSRKASIGYTTQQMSVDEVQTLTVEWAVSGATYNWEITSGGGSLSSATGLSVDYTAPTTNANCANNPNITLSTGGAVSDSLQLAVNGAGGSHAVRWYRDVEITHTSFDGCTQVSGTCTGCYITRFKKAKYSKILCNGSNMFDEGHYYSCGSDNSCTYWSCVYCAAGEQCPGSCAGKCPYPSDSEIINNCINQCGSVDVRTDLLKEQGCCPYQLLDS
ncbi:MAG: hypothetical protein U9R34_07055, partial [Nanoarchaeota archaeon]|nr:hypothetical protein [Nanoarchaeota archaeon]